MPQLVKISCLILLACLMVFAWTAPVQAIPPLPASFYGTVKVNGQNAPDGTLVRALIDGQAVALDYTQTYQGDSVYALDVPGDDSSTIEIEGGLEQDVIQFEVGGLLCNQSGTWKIGISRALNLTVANATPIADPQATPTPVFTQTAIVLENVGPTDTMTPGPKKPGETQADPALAATLPGATEMVPVAATQAQDNSEPLRTRPAPEALTGSSDTQEQADSSMATMTAPEPASGSIDQSGSGLSTGMANSSENLVQKEHPGDLEKRLIGILLIAIIAFLALPRRKKN